MVKLRKIGNKVHNLKLFIINNPTMRDHLQIALVCGVDKSTVAKAFKKLNIRNRLKPDYCRG